jgi:hypothetical protein
VSAADFLGLKVSRTEQPTSSEDVRGRWWMETGDDLAKGVFSVVDRIRDSQRGREDEYELHGQLYANKKVLRAMPWYRGTSVGNDSPRLIKRLRFNVVSSCVDTASSMIGKSKPRPLFATDAGDYDLQLRAKNLQKYCDGVFYEGEVYRRAQMAFVLAGVFGSGIVHSYWEKVTKDGDYALRFDAVLPWEMVVDDEDGMFKDPREIHREKFVFADVLRDRFPGHDEKITDGAKDKLDGLGRWQAGRVRVIESWHLPSGPGATDGKHAISIDGTCLFEEEYTSDRFPFAKFDWKPSLTSWFGMGLAEELQDIQAEVNRAAAAIQNAHHLMSVPRVFVDSQSNVKVSDIQNMPGGVVRYTGRQPVPMTAQAMNAEAYTWLDNCIRRAYELTGISQLQASGKKQPGVDSAVAIREVNDIASARFEQTGQRWEEFFTDITNIIVDMTRKAFEDKLPLAAVKSKDGKFVRDISWKDSALPANSYHLQVFPTSVLPTQPSARIQTVTEWVQNGVMPQKHALRALQIPDLDSIADVVTANDDFIEWQINEMLTKGMTVGVEDMADLESCVEIGTAHLLIAQRTGVPEERVELLRQWLRQCGLKLNPPAPTPDPNAAQPPMDAGAPPPPSAPPQPDLGPPPGPPAGAGPLLTSDPMAKVIHGGADPMSGPSGEFHDGGMDVMGTLKDYSNAGTAFQKQDGGMMTSDPGAKQQMYWLGRAHQANNEKPLYPMPDDITEPPSPTTDPRAKQGEARGLREAQFDMPSSAPRKDPNHRGTPPPTTGHDPTRPPMPKPQPQPQQPLPPGVKPGHSYDPSRPETMGVKPPKQASLPEQFVDSLQPYAFNYKEGIPGTDPSKQHFGIMTTDLKKTPMGAAAVVRDPATGYEAVDTKEMAGAVLPAAMADLGKRVKQLEAAKDDPGPDPQRWIHDTGEKIAQGIVDRGWVRERTPEEKQANGEWLDKKIDAIKSLNPDYVAQKQAAEQSALEARINETKDQLKREQQLQEEEPRGSYRRYPK